MAEFVLSQRAGSRCRRGRCRAGPTEARRGTLRDCGRRKRDDAPDVVLHARLAVVQVLAIPRPPDLGGSWLLETMVWKCDSTLECGIQGERNTKNTSMCQINKGFMDIKRCCICKLTEKVFTNNSGGRQRWSSKDFEREACPHCKNRLSQQQSQQQAQQQAQQAQQAQLICPADGGMHNWQSGGAKLFCTKCAATKTL